MSICRRSEFESNLAYFKSVVDHSVTSLRRLEDRSTLKIECSTSSILVTSLLEFFDRHVLWRGSIQKAKHMINRSGAGNV